LHPRGKRPASDHIKGGETTIHSGILGSLPIDIASFKLAALSFTGGIALITAILLANTLVDATTTALRPFGRRGYPNFGRFHNPNVLWGTYAPCARAIVPPVQWAARPAPSPAVTSGISGLRPLGDPVPLGDCSHHRPR
jgi:hypothetical protein